MTKTQTVWTQAKVDDLVERSANVLIDSAQRNFGKHGADHHWLMTEATPHVRADFIVAALNRFTKSHAFSIEEVIRITDHLTGARTLPRTDALWTKYRRRILATEIIDEWRQYQLAQGFIKPRSLLRSTTYSVRIL